MIRLYNERRNQEIMVEVERRQTPQKEIAIRFKITWNNLRQIVHRLRRVTKCNRIVSDK